MRLIRVGLIISLTIAATTFGPLSLAGPATASETANLLNGSWQVYAKGQDVSIRWDLNADADTTFRVNGIAVSEGLDTGHVYLTDQVPGAKLDLNLAATMKLGVNEVDDVSSEFGISPQAASELYQNIYASRIPFQVPEGQGQIDSAQAYSLLPDVSIFRYQTFIPYEYVDAPLFGCTSLGPDFYFAGNNRTFDPLSNEVKTRIDAWIDWSNGGAISPRFFVGGTTLYHLNNGLYEWFDSGHATTESMSIYPSGQTSNSVAFKMVQDVANPLCLEAGTMGISFNLDVKVWRAGRYTLNGVAIKVPSHEAYIKDSNLPTWYPVLKAGFYSFQCLNRIGRVILFAEGLNAFCVSSYSLDQVR